MTKEDKVQVISGEPYIKVSEVLSIVEDMINNQDTLTLDTSTLNSLSTSILKSVQGKIQTFVENSLSLRRCSCWEPNHWYLKGWGTCNGTKDREPCSCNGFTQNCDFYPEKRCKLEN